MSNVKSMNRFINILQFKKQLFRINFYLKIFSFLFNVLIKYKEEWNYD